MFWTKITTFFKNLFHFNKVNIMENISVTGAAATSSIPMTDNINATIQAAADANTAVINDPATNVNTASVISDPAVAQPVTIGLNDTGSVSISAPVSSTFNKEKGIWIKDDETKGGLVSGDVKLSRTLAEKIDLYKKFKDLVGDDFELVESDLIKVLDKLL